MAIPLLIKKRAINQVGTIELDMVDNSAGGAGGKRFEPKDFSLVFKIDDPDYATILTKNPGDIFIVNYS